VSDDDSDAIGDRGVLSGANRNPRVGDSGSSLQIDSDLMSVS